MEVSSQTIVEEGNFINIKTIVMKDNGELKHLYFRTEKANRQYVNCETADALLVGLLIPAMKLGERLYFQDHVSARLLWGIRKYVMPALNKMNPTLKMIEINAKTIKLFPKGGGVVATGISGGVDSFYSILNNSSKIEDDCEVIEALMFCNLYRLYCDEHEAQKFFALDVVKKRELSESLGLNFLSVDTNLWDFYSEFRYVQVHTFYIIANALVFQGFIGRYLYSSGYTLNEFEMNFDDTAHYDVFLQGFIRTECFEMISESNDIDRITKTNLVAQSKTAVKYLDVCNNKLLANSRKKTNCSCCDKCVRTMLTLDVLGKIDDFSDVFDLYDYHANKERYWVEYRYFTLRRKDTHMEAVLLEAKKAGYKLPRFYLCKCLAYFITLQIAKLKEKVGFDEFK